MDPCCPKGRPGVYFYEMFLLRLLNRSASVLGGARWSHGAPGNEWTLENICELTSGRYCGHFGTFWVILGGHFLGSDYHFGSISALRGPFSDLIAPFALPRCGATSKYF